MKNMTLKSYFFFMSLIVSGSGMLNAQNLYMPINIAEAFKNETRSFDGNPGSNYWMNNSKYKIDVELDPGSNELNGKATIVYFNNSPDTLKNIVLRIYMDFYKKGNRRNEEIDSSSIHDGVEISKMIVGGEEIFNNSDRVKRDGTNLLIDLNQFIEPGKNIELELEWEYKIPAVTKIRTGVYYSSSYFISLWYPQLSVYDDIDGWDLMQYTGFQEFYNDYNDFKVNITVPKEYVVWATGNQTNIHETFSIKYINRIKNAQNDEKLTNIITAEDRVENNITKNEFNVWKYEAENVPDFAFAVSDKYLWDLKKIELEDESKKNVLVGAVYNKNSEDFYEVADIACEAIKLMSTDLPGIPFPYSNLTVFNSDGDSGMEFPMIINDGSFPKRSRTVGITVHELLHQYFPFYVGTNERKYAWMDEGWARMMQFDIQEKIEPSFNKSASIVEKYSKVGGSQFDVPLMVPSNLFDSYLPYKTHAYTRPAMALLSLMAYKGTAKFKEGLAEFISRWKYKHPIPYDFFNTFNEVYKEDLSWFWNPWFFEFAKADLGIKNVFEDENNMIVEIENVGKLPLPVEVNVIYNSGEEKIYRESTGVWREAKTFKMNVGNKKDIKSIQLGSIEIPDVDISNNNCIINNMHIRMFP